MSNTQLQSIIDAGHWIDAQGWCPATGGNFSLRTGDNEVLITASGRHKGQLCKDDLLRADLTGTVLDSDVKPSAETLLHTRLYQLDSGIGAVLHTHSVNATVLSLVSPGEWLCIEQLEMQKSLAGNQTHDAAIRIAIFDNTQDMRALADRLAARWQQRALSWGLLVRGHGLYAWGRDLAEAKRHLEGLEFLFACQLELKRLGVSA